jgi:cell division protein FtsL
MQKYSLKFIAPGLEESYIEYRLPYLLKFFKLLYIALIVINLIFAIGFFILKRTLSIENSLGMMMAF